MSLARFATALFIAAGVLISAATIAHAGDSAAGVKQGSVSRDEFRIRRGAPVTNAASAAPANKKLYATVQKNKILPSTKALLPQTPSLDSLVQADDYASPIASPIARPLPAAASIHQAPRAPESKYVWGQSAAGGYFDASGQISHTVMGDELYKFGGKFMDGVVVPKTPVVCNFKGHVYFPYVVKRNQ